MNFQTAREKLTQKLTNVSEIAEGVIRGIRRSNNRDVAAYIFDFNNRLPETVGELSDYLDEVVGPSYFDGDVSQDLRWNNYLYIVVDKVRQDKSSFRETKRNVEADRNYARKFIINEEDLDRVLDELDSVAEVEGSIASTDIVRIWSDRLSAVGLEDVLDVERPIADVIRSISVGSAKQTVRAKKTTGVDLSMQLVESHIASIDMNRFRPYPKKKNLDKFGKANLLFGSNGVGKTSLLEGLEFLYCGANRRSDCSSASAVEGVLLSGRSVKTMAQQPLSDFKTRQRLWYGGDDNSRQNKLPNQFARFNFLNSDAAAELSLRKESPKDGNVESLAALLSGHEAALMWRRIQEIRKAVSEEVRSKRSERAVATTDKEGKEKELLALENVPSQADAVFSVLLKDLEGIRWRVLPASKEVIDDKFIEVLSSLTSQLGVIHELDWLLGPITLSDIDQQASTLRRASEDVRAALPAAHEDKQARGVLTQRYNLAKSKLIALEGIPHTALAELEALSVALKQSSDELALSAHVFAALPSDAPPAGWQPSMGGKSLSDARAEATAELAEIGAELDTLQKRLATATRTQSDFQRVMSELHSWAKKAIEHQHSDSNCPVCGTEFSPGELIRRMSELSLTPMDMAISELSRRIEHIAAEKVRAEGKASWLGLLDNFINTLPSSDVSITVSDAQLAVLGATERQQVLIAAKQSVQQQLESYARNGLSLTVIEDLCRPVDGDPYEVSTSLDVVEALNGTRRYQNQLQSAMDELDSRIIQRNDWLEHRIKEVNINTEGALDIAIERLNSRQRAAQRSCDGCQVAHRYLDVAAIADLRMLLASMETCVLRAKKVQVALRTDGSSAERSTRLREQIEQVSGRLTRINISLERLADAQRVFDDIIENHSLDNASAAIVAAVHKVADSIFGRIHAPSEYSITAHPEAPLMRREDHSSIQLNQVSTGQRSAYALSIFLAMNAQVKDGPKVILLDDPISHIDDLNALSFLDYLRNLVINSDRQVFFATADDKIAGIFAHKFGFLGDEFRIIEMAR